MPQIETLIEDVYKAIETGEHHATEKDVEDLGNSLATLLVERLFNRRDEPRLRISNLGTKCRKKLWYSIRHPELGETLDGQTRLKFLAGDIWEAVLIFLAKAAGHTVEHEQQEVELYGVKGRIDAVIDGHLVDIKSASPYSFKKFAKGLDVGNDTFGYLTQIGAYAKALGAKVASFWAVEKASSALTMATHAIPDRDWEGEIAEVRGALASDIPPERAYAKKGVECNYCAFKGHCW
jgi:hypothetical protein